MRRNLLLALIAPTVLFVTGCGSSPGTVTVLGYTVVIKTAPPASAVAGTSVAVAFTVTENESDGTSKPASGKTFTVTVTAGGGTVNGSTQASLTTAADGSVSATWLLGSTVGTQTVRGAVTAGQYLDVSLAATAPVAAQLGFATAPSATVASGGTLAVQPVVQLKDAAGNAVAQAGVTVTVSLPAGGATLGGTVTAVTDGNGRATFAGLTLTGSPGTKSLQFAATLVGGAVTVNASVAILAGPTTQLVLTTQPSANAQLGVSFAQQPVVLMLDANSAPTGLGGIAVIATIETGGGSLTGGTGVATVNGLAAFTDLRITGTAGTRTLKFTAVVNGTTLTVITNPIVVGP